MRPESLAYVYARETKADADTAKVLTMDEARRIEQYCQAADAPKRKVRWFDRAAF